MLSAQTAFSQHSTRDNFSGAWEDPYSWMPEWPAPVRDSIDVDITVSGYIKTSGSISFANDSTNFIIKDTLVIAGNLYLGNKNRLTIDDTGIIIIRGSLQISNKTTIVSNGYLVITGSVIKIGSQIQGAFTSNDTKPRVYIGGPVPGNLTGSPLYPVLDAVPPYATAPYPGSGVCYGNMTDIVSDPIYSFFMTTCILSAFPGPDQVLEYSFETEMSAELPPGTKGKWTVISGSGSFTDMNSPFSEVKNLHPGENIFSWEVWNIREPGCTGSSQIRVTVKDLFIPSVITPNGDGQNDLFRFNTIRDGVKLRIFNKWGIMEYESSGYRNDWGGTDRNGKPLPEDTYFYILYFDKPRKGTVLIVR